jgi:Tol biopolymer transport system component
VFETPTPNGSTAVATVPSTCRSQAECAKHIRYLTSPNSQPDQNFNPAWSPDGRTVAYVHFTLGTPPDIPPAADIWTMKWNGANQQPVVTSPLFDFRPEWGQR